MKNAHRSVGIGEGHHHHFGTCETCRHQHFLAHGVTEYHRVTGLGGLPHALRVHVQREERNRLGLQQPRQRLTGPAKAADQHVVALGHAFDQQVMQVQRLHHPVLFDHPAGDRLGMHDQERCQQHRQQDGGNTGLLQRSGNQPQIAGQRQQDKAELPALRQRQGTAQSVIGLVPQSSRQKEHDSQFDRHQQDKNQQHILPALEQHRHVDFHADGDKEESQQDIAEWPYILLNLITIFGFRDQHPGDKSAQCQ